MSFPESLVGAQGPLASLCGFYHYRNVDTPAGAQSVISYLQSTRSVVTKLQLNNNLLGDDVVSTLFAFLRSPSESVSRHQISEIHLNSNNISCRSLSDIADYIVENQVLKTLWLANVSSHLNICDLANMG